MKTSPHADARGSSRIALAGAWSSRAPSDQRGEDGPRFLNVEELIPLGCRDTGTNAVSVVTAPDIAKSPQLVVAIGTSPSSPRWNQIQPSCNPWSGYVIRWDSRRD